MQMYKILALNCLISAYSLSVLYLDGVKFGDGQMMITGVAIALCFLFISRSQPLTKLSRERPHTTIFSPYMMLSLLGQFAIHICVLIYAVSAAKAASPSLE
jgi:cation-transporting ATPase 13A1